MAKFKYYDGTGWVELLKSSDISAWAKASSKPTYTASEVGALASNGTAVNSSKLNNQAASYYLNYNNLTNKPTIPTETTVSGWGFTKNAGTVKKVNNISPDSNGNVSLNMETYIVTSLTELNTALNAGKKTIMLCDGFTATVSSTINLPAGTTIIGNGGTFTRANNFKQSMFNSYGNCEISHVSIEGNRTNISNATWDTTIEIAARANDYIHDITITDGNEGIIAYGDNIRIEHCKFTNMGGNAIHFSGGSYTVVDGCYVNGANKNSGMGHEDGCIIWSNECTYITCINNYVEDGKTGFGSIDTYDNSYVKIVNNTIKNCTNSFDLYTTNDPAVDVLIQGNYIYNSGTLEINKSTDSLTSQGRYSIINNTFFKSKIRANRIDTILIQGNIMTFGQIDIDKCTNIKIENNVIKKFTTPDTSYPNAITCGESSNISILGNYIRSDAMAVNCYASTNVMTSNNKIRSYNTNTGGWAVHGSVTPNFYTNEVFSYCRGCEGAYGGTMFGNTVYVKNTSLDSIRYWGGTTNALNCCNRTNGVMALPADGSDGNSTIANVNQTVPSGLFLTVTNTLTRITTTGLDSVVAGDDYFAILTPASGRSLPDSITISMGGNQTVGRNEYYYDKSTGELIVFGVRANLTITATAS